MTSSDEYFMRMAIKCAEESIARGEPGFGAIIVDSVLNKVVSRGYNHASNNPLFHGEVDAINTLSAEFQKDGKNVYECSSTLVLYTTAEPCPMCAAAIVWTGIPRVVYGTSIQTLMKYNWSQMNISCHEISKKSWLEQDITGGILEMECNKLYESGPPWKLPSK